MTATTTPASASAALRFGAEALGTFMLVFGVIGAATFGADFDSGAGGLNLGFLGVALALGLTVVGGAYALGPISGGHFSPAVTLGARGGRPLPLATRERLYRRSARRRSYRIDAARGHRLGRTRRLSRRRTEVRIASTGWGHCHPVGSRSDLHFLSR